jgi:alpha-ribazole phosphatase
MMTTLWLIRHGETQWNVTRRFQGSADEPLNTNGEQQACALVSRLSTMKFDAIYASDMLRVQQTAKHALNGDVSRIQYDARLRELRFGTWEGLTWDEIKTQYPDDLNLWLENRSETPHGGDKLVDVVQRLNDFLQEIRTTHENAENILIFAHGGILAILITLLIDVDPKKWWQFGLKNCAVSEVRIFNRGAVLSRLNDEQHLPQPVME